MNRLVNIDQLKGVAILLVVIGHVFVYSFGDANSLLLKWLASFHMPLFMFLSGYLAYSFDFKGKSIFQSLRNKASTLLFPFLTMGSLYTWCFNLDWISFIYGGVKLGYWFTFTLFEIFIVYYLTNYLLEKINKKRNIWFDLAGFLIVYILLEYIRLFNFLPEKINDFLNLFLLTTYVKYFVLGVFVKRIFRINFWLNNSNLCFSVMLILFFILFSFNQTIYTNFISRFCVGVAGIWCCIYLVTRYSNSLPFGKQFAFLGTRSLDIYVIHYFFLMNFSGFAFCFPEKFNITMQIFISLPLALMVILLSLLVSQIIRSSNILSFFMLGIRKH